MLPRSLPQLPLRHRVYAGSGSGAGNWEISLGYQFNDYHLLHSPVDNGQAFHTSGYNVGFTRFFNNWFGIEAQTGFGYGTTGTGTVPTGQKFKSLFAGAGPHISFRNDSRWEPWGHGLVGIEHFRFPYGGSTAV